MDDRHRRGMEKAQRRIDAWTGGPLSLSGIGLTSQPDLSGLRGLTVLDLSHNSLGVVKASRLPAGLENLDLSLCDLTTMPDVSRLRGLSVLVMSRNNFYRGGALLLPEGLKILRLADCNLSGQPNLSAVAITDLDLSGNDLGEVEISLLPPRLETLKISHCGLTRQPNLLRLDRLVAISLGANRLRKVEASLLPAGLERLDLEYCALNSQPNLSDRLNVTSLDLSRNKLRDVEASLFPPRLRRLVLALCDISRQPDLSRLSGLAELDLAGNELREIKGSLLPARLEKLDLTGNGALGLPKSVGHQGDPRMLLAYLGQAVEPLLEVKVAFIGTGEAGKTTLRRALTESTPPPPDLDRTRSFEWEELRLAVEPLHREGPAPGNAQNGNAPLDPVEVRFHLYDFGGQKHLWNSHRLFLANRRTIYVIVADVTLPPEENGLESWVAYVDDVHERGLYAEAAEQIARDADPERLSLESVIYELRGTRRRPPIVVVLTGCASAELPRGRPRRRPADAGTLTVVQRLEEEFPDLAVVRGYDAFNDAARAQGVGDLRAALADAARRLDEVWLERYPRSTKAMLADFAEAFGYGAADSEDTPGGEPESAYLNYDTAIERVRSRATEVKGDNAIAPETYLRMIRDLGLVHWLGDRHDLRRDERMREAMDSERAREVWNPRWIRVPIAQTLWADEGMSRDAVISKSTLTGSIVDHLHRLGWTRGADDLALIQRAVEFLRLSDLIVRVPRGATEDLFLIPDRMPSGNPMRHHPMNDTPTWEMWEFDYLDPLVRPVLMGRLLNLRDRDEREMSMSRMRLRIDGIKVELVFVEPNPGSPKTQLVVAGHHPQNPDLARQAVAKAVGHVEAAFPRHLRERLPPRERSATTWHAPGPTRPMPTPAAGDDAVTVDVEAQRLRQVELWVQIHRRVLGARGEKAERAFAASVQQCLIAWHGARDQGGPTPWESACFLLVQPSRLLQDSTEYKLTNDGRSSVPVGLSFVRDRVQPFLKKCSQKNPEHLVGDVWHQLTNRNALRRNQLNAVIQGCASEPALRAVASAAKAAIKKVYEA